MNLQFIVYGEPKPQGSKKVVPIIKNGKPVMKNGHPLTRAVNDNPKLAQWRQEIAQVAREAFVKVTGKIEPALLDGPLYLAVTFRRPRPKGHYGTGRNAGKLKPSAPRFPTTRPDTVKLVRAVEDALTGVVWKDDSQIVHHLLFKEWGACFKVVVYLSEKSTTLNATE